MRIATWNLERKKPTSPRGAEAIDYLYAKDAEVMVLTETRTTLPRRGGHLLTADPPVGERFASDERKVALWSSQPLQTVAVDSDIDPSRFVCAKTHTSIGPVLIVAVCIPWHMAEVTHHQGTKRRPWEQHLTFLDHLRRILALVDEPTVVAGDFNQRIPRVKGGNREAAAALDATFRDFDILTSGTVAGCSKPGIDHIAISHHLNAVNIEGWPHNVTGNRLTDHDGVLADVRLSTTAAP